MGMSYHDRDGENANSAVIVTVTPDDFPVKGFIADREATGNDTVHPLAGVAFQRELEQKSQSARKGKRSGTVFWGFLQK